MIRSNDWLRPLIALILALGTAAPLSAAPQHAASPQAESIAWENWRDDVFRDATEKKKLVILDLVAVWCHWCHVMEEQTYSNAEVVAAIKKDYIAVKVDQDARPDLGVRYQDYGWPATIIFDSSGKELAKRAGFVEPADMAALLKRLAAKPEPEEEAAAGPKLFSTTADLSESLQAELLERYYKSFDTEVGGLKSNHKYLEPDTMELALVRTAAKQARDEEFAKRTLNENFKLFDPVWGGVYQYSTKRNWDNPHYEKIVYSQASNLYLYSFAYSIWKDQTFLNAAKRIHRYLEDFMTAPDGAYYTSQDADVVKGKHSAEYFSLGDEERRKIGIPAIDTHIYSRENGTIIAALAALYAASGDDAILADAVKAAEVISKTHANADGCYRHEAKESSDLYLGDNLGMGRAALALYTATGGRSWLTAAEKAMDCIRKNFTNGAVNGDIPGFFTSRVKQGAVLEPIRNLAENILTTRFSNLLYRYTGKKEYRELAEHGMKYIATDKIALSTGTEPGIILAANELRGEPLHITIVAPKSDATAKSLYLSALAYPSAYKRLEWWDKSEGPMPNPDVQYPQLEKPAAFVCTNKRCSLPIFTAEGITTTVRRFEAPAK